MITTVTCNPAFDLTYTVQHLVPGEVHRVGAVRTVLGGKGVNVSRVLHQLGVETVATGLADNAFGRMLDDEDGFQARFVPCLPSVRRTLVVQDGEQTTSLWEPGPTSPPDAGDRLSAAVLELLPNSSALVVSGSLPRGLDPMLPRRLARLASKAGVPCVLDVDDDALRAAADGSAAVLVPNHEELRRLLDHRGPLEVVAAASEVAERSGAPVVVTLGSEGMLALIDGEAWHAALPEKIRGNPTGAGDAAAAGIACGLAHSTPWPEILDSAVATASATVMAPVAGQFHVPTYERWRGQVPVRRIRTLVLER